MLVSMVTAVVMHFVAPPVESRYRTLPWFDAFGLALVTVAGTAKALDVGAPALVAIVMGAVTGSVGGIIRDTLGHVLVTNPGVPVWWPAFCLAFDLTAAVAMVWLLKLWQTGT